MSKLRARGFWQLAELQPERDQLERLFEVRNQAPLGYAADESVHDQDVQVESVLLVETLDVLAPERPEDVGIGLPELLRMLLRHGAGIPSPTRSERGRERLQQLVQA